MINLIPPSAKKSIKVEYWVRVLTVWLMVWAFALICSAAIMFPAYTLVDAQVDVYERNANEISSEVNDYKIVSKELVQSSQQAKIIIDEEYVESFSDYLDLFEGLQSEDIVLSQISLDRETKENITLEPIKVSGTASDRKSLAAFRDRLLAHPKFDAVDLPISNLARDKDIQFAITVTIANE